MKVLSRVCWVEVALGSGGPEQVVRSQVGAAKRDMRPAVVLEGRVVKEVQGWGHHRTLVVLFFFILLQFSKFPASICSFYN